MKKIFIAMLSCAAVFGAMSITSMAKEIQVSVGDNLQTAVDNAEAGDTLRLAAGEYSGNIIINEALTIEGPAEGEAVIKYQPVTDTSGLVNSGYYPVISATAPLTMNGNIIVAGPVGASTDYDYLHQYITGVLSENNLNLNGITFKDIRHDPISGMQCGLPIVANGNETTEVNIINCEIVDFQKQAIRIQTPNAKVTISNNTITGVGDTDVTAQNGIVIWSCGADSVVSGNQISDMRYTLDSATSTGIMSCNGAAFKASDNTLTNIESPIGYYNSDEDDITKENNTIIDGSNVAFIGGTGYPTIAAAIEAAVINDIVEVVAGTYDEDITIDKAITLKGSEDAVFSGVITVNAAEAVLEGINLHYEGDNLTYGNVIIAADGVTVRDCDFYGYYTGDSEAIGQSFGLVRVNENKNIIFDGCTFQTNTFGIFVAMKSGEIKNCTFKPLESGDTRKSLAINYNGMEDVKIMDNTFYGMRILTNKAEFSRNSFIGFTSPVVIWNDDIIDLSGSYWGIDNPDLTTLLGTELKADSYYTDSELTNLVHMKDMTQVQFGGTLEGAEISPDGMTLSQGDEIVTAWKGEVEGGVNGDITVTATSGEDTAKTTLTAPSVEGNALFYVLVNAQPDGMVFTYSNTSAE